MAYVIPNRKSDLIGFKFTVLINGEVDTIYETQIALCKSYKLKMVNTTQLSRNPQTDQFPGPLSLAQI